MANQLAKHPNPPEDSAPRLAPEAVPSESLAGDLCSRGIRFHDEGQLIAALSCLEKSLQASPSPLARSYLGVCIAAERGQVNRGIALCGEAIAAEPGNPTHHLNLARILIRAGRKTEALAALRCGPAAGEHAEIRVLLEQLGTRRPPPFPALPRRHPLNRMLGLLLSRLGLR